MQINPSVYLAAKAANTVKISNNGDGTYNVVFQQFDPNTGAATGKQNVVVDLADTQAAISNMTSLLTAWQTLAADLTATV